MRFLLDKNFPKAAAGLLHNAGHEVFDLRGTSNEGIDDGIVFQKAQEYGATLLTTDRDFFHTIPHLHESHIAGKDIANRVFQLRDKTWLAYPSIGG